MPGEDIVLTTDGGRAVVTRLEDNTRRYSNATNAVAVGDVVYVSGTDTVARADRDDAGKVPPIGVVGQLDGDSNCYVCHAGGTVFKPSWGLTAGNVYWLSDTAGELSSQPTKPPPPDPLPRAFLIGVAVHTNVLLVTCIPFDLYE